MSPRGVAIPDVERQLFDAAERVLRRDGPDGLNSRAITSEAGTAKGLLYRHFQDLDAFLAAFIADRAERLAEAVSGLDEQVGRGNVADNLTDAALSVTPGATALIDLVRSRWSLGAHFGRSGRPHAGGLRDLERRFAAYLDAERKAGRVASDADTDAVATALVGAVHQLAISPHSPADLRRQIGRVVAVLISGILAGDRSPAS